MSRPSTMYADSHHPSTRPSLFPSSVGSGGPSLGTSTTSQSTSRLQTKQQELEGLKELREYSARLVKELEIMGQGLDAIKKGEESVAQVMSSWQTVFRGIQVAQASINEKTSTQDPNPNLVPDTLVRIPLEPDLEGEAIVSAGGTGEVVVGQAVGSAGDA